MPLSRRRFLTIAAGTGVLALAGAARATPGLVHWRGTALGAQAEMLLPGPGAGEAIDAALAEIDRLEGILSLYRPASALCRLNAAGRLAAPPLELVEVLAHAQAISRLSGGAFDVTVQPLWERAAQGLAPTAGDLALVDWRGLEVSSAEVRLARPGMKVTLNGIAQGYVTDAVARLLRQRGYESVLIDLGETRALGRHPDGRPWRVGAGPEGVPLDLEGATALATSAPAASAPHLFDPTTGASPTHWRTVTVRAASAMSADALSTALMVLPRGRAERAFGASGAKAAWLWAADGTVIAL